jgi:hypothetical protein
VVPETKTPPITTCIWVCGYRGWGVTDAPEFNIRGVHLVLVAGGQGPQGGGGSKLTCRIEEGTNILRAPW